ncbi:MAG: CHC2 zinc finger domain-containing protein [Thermomicrobiales bacterium]
MTSVPKAGAIPASPYPFGGGERSYRLALQAIPTRDVLAEIEAARWLALDLSNDPILRKVAEYQLEALVDELLRRQRLLEASTGDPLRPVWPRPDGDLRARIDAVKAAWPIERFCTVLLGAILHPAGRNRWRASCPLPGHDDRTPSFMVYGDDDRAWCFGCNRGGDVIALTGYALGVELQ